MPKFVYFIFYKSWRLFVAFSIWVAPSKMSALKHLLTFLRLFLLFPCNCLKTEYSELNITTTPSFATIFANLTCPRLKLMNDAEFQTNACHSIIVSNMTINVSNYSSPPELNHLARIYAFGSTLQRRFAFNSTKKPLKLIMGFMDYIDNDNNQWNVTHFEIPLDEKRKSIRATFVIGKECLQGYEGEFCLASGNVNRTGAFLRLDNRTMLKVGPCEEIYCSVGQWQIKYIL